MKIISPSKPTDPHFCICRRLRLIAACSNLLPQLSRQRVKLYRDEVSVSHTMSVWLRVSLTGCIYRALHNDGGVLLKKHLSLSWHRQEDLRWYGTQFFIGGRGIHHRRSRAHSLTVVILKIYYCGAKLTIGFTEYTQYYEKCRNFHLHQC